MSESRRARTHTHNTKPKRWPCLERARPDYSIEHRRVAQQQLYFPPRCPEIQLKTLTRHSSEVIVSVGAHSSSDMHDVRGMRDACVSKSTFEMRLLVAFIPGRLKPASNKSAKYVINHHVNISSFNATARLGRLAGPSA